MFLRFVAKKRLFFAKESSKKSCHKPHTNYFLDPIRLPLGQMQLNFFKVR